MSEAPNAYSVFDEHGITRIPQYSKVYQRVAVASSDLVAQIVGRNGHKIKALRARTNTYINIPARGEDPIFVIIGSPKEVAAAKLEVVAEADRITQTHSARMNTAIHITECVAVPSSEHVAMIVGPKRSNRTLRELLSICADIKIPEPGEDPIFIFTGSPEDVAAAKRRVVSAANHITKVLAAEKNKDMQNQSTQFPDSPINELVTIDVRVPYGTVGLVVGPKGATIKRIQKQTSTFIFTPTKCKEPCFEVTGKPDDVEVAKREIESCIATRTGASITEADSDFEDAAQVIARRRKSWPPPTRNPQPPQCTHFYPEGFWDEYMCTNLCKLEAASSTHSCSSNSIEETAVVSPKIFERNI